MQRTQFGIGTALVLAGGALAAIASPAPAGDEPTAQTLFDQQLKQES